MEAIRARSHTATGARHPPQPVRRVVAARCLRGVITRLSDNIEDPVLRTAVKLGGTLSSKDHKVAYVHLCLLCKAAADLPC
ncbi:hypothetical protein HaLaN_06695 [Haematococcus lacustris]|uniref:Uncharacterized protein n=1 Tax=Haematococcus lacustris TaxID=44745 RepID=A0A699YVZ4_HAELA|nr:hypothetical protein HaLaN_06695 [Haematococcus lacustris]